MVSSRSLATGFDEDERAGVHPRSAVPATVRQPVVRTRPISTPHMELTMGGVRMHRLDAAGVAAEVTDALRAPRRRPLAIGSVNLDHVFHFGLRRPASAAATPLRDVRWLMLIDGAPVAKRATARTQTVWPRITGADLLPDLLTLAAGEGARVGFLGGDHSTSRALLDALTERWPDLDVAAVWTPDREVVDDPQQSAQLASDIADEGVDLLVVGLGKPRQERWIAAHGMDTGAGVLTAFGAAASFLAGTERRAPMWMRRAGVEWLYRLASEPRRLWRRYLVQGPVALASLVRSPVTIDYVGLPGVDPPR